MKKRAALLAFVTAAWMALLPLAAALAEKTADSGGITYTVTSSSFVKGLSDIAPMEGNQFLVVDLVMKAAADAQQPENPERLMLAVDSRDRAYTPILLNRTSVLAAGLQQDETGLRLVFEVPESAAGYDLVVLSATDGAAAGRIALGKSYGTAPGDTNEVVFSVQEQGYTLQIHSAAQSLSAFADTAPEGMKYVLLDMTVTGEDGSVSVSDLARQLTLVREGVTYESLIPTRGTNMLLLAGLRLGGLVPAVRGRLCFLVPREWTELAGFRLGDVSYDQSLPLAGELTQSAFAVPGQDGTYTQGGWKVAVNGMKLAQKGDLADPPSGYKYILVNVTLTNTAVQKMTVSSELAFAMTDDQGNELAQAWFADSGETVDTSLSFDKSVTGEVAFLLPDGAKAGAFRVHLTMLGEPLVIDPAKYLTE